MTHQANISSRLLRIEDIPSIATAFQSLDWNKPASQYERYLEEQEQGHRTVVVAFKEGVFVGYLTILWMADYPPFRAENIPEIRDFNVLPDARREGIGTHLMDEAEKMIAMRSSKAGLGVGLTADYGAAQRLYVKRGYIPDGAGLMSNDRAVEHGQQVHADDDLTLQFVKIMTTSSPTTIKK